MAVEVERRCRREGHEKRGGCCAWRLVMTVAAVSRGIGDDPDRVDQAGGKGTQRWGPAEKLLVGQGRGAHCLPI